ncbi:MAG: hypothetical protein HW391_1950 [Chloroflexi bacterium]|nr:hypothetical protein [Chloroflexota bacterium]
MRFFRLLGGLVAIALAIGLAGSLFQAGYMAGLTADGAGPVGVPPYGWHTFGWGFGGGIFHLLGSIFVLFLVIGLLKAAFWGGHRGSWTHGPRDSWGPGGPDDHHRFEPWKDRARVVHDEWHRSAEGSSSGSTARPSGADPGPTTST